MEPKQASEHTELGELLAQVQAPPEPSPQPLGYEVEGSNGEVIKLNEHPLDSFRF